MIDQYGLWTRELVAISKGFVPSIKVPGTERRDVDEPVSGYWRILGAVSKHDTPVLIWRPDGQDSHTFQIGRGRPRNSVEHEAEWHEFLSWGFLKCAAVRKADWVHALETGWWADGRPSRAVVEVNDRAEFTAYLMGKNDQEFNAFLLRRAKDLAKAKRPLPGVAFLEDHAK